MKSSLGPLPLRHASGVLFTDHRIAWHKINPSSDRQVSAVPMAAHRMVGKNHQYLLMRR
ncbi:MAG: hypothetical protein ACLRZN_07265 [Dialister invisus]